MLVACVVVPTKSQFPWKRLVSLDSHFPRAWDLGCNMGQLMLLIFQ